MPSVPIRDATPNDHDRIASLLATAFLSTPLAQWLVPEIDKRRTYSAVYFDRIVDMALEDRRAIVHVADDCAGVAVWYNLPATGLADPIDVVTELIPVEPDPPAAARAVLLREWLTDFRPQMAHCRLAYVAVAEPRRNQGLARALLTHRHRQLDMAGIPAHSLAQTSTDLALLGLTGYYPGHPNCVAGGPLVWPAWRGPRTALPLQRADS